MASSSFADAIRQHAVLAAQDEWNRRIVEAITDTPESHSEAIAEAVLRRVAGLIWDHGFISGALPELKQENPYVKNLG